MSRVLVSLAVISALLAAGTADAADKKAAQAKKLYRWVDKDGKVQFSDSLPAEAIDQARTEMSGSGRVTADIGRALTEEERIAAEKAALEAAEREAELEQTRKSEEAMLASFATEDDLRRSQLARVTLLQQTLEAIEAGISSQRASLSALLLQASEAELSGGAVKPKQVATIRQLHHEIGKQQQMLIVKQAELVDADKQLEYLLQRFRELKAAEAGGSVSDVPAGDGPAEGADAPAESAPADAPRSEAAPAG